MKTNKLILCLLLLVFGACEKEEEKPEVQSEIRHGIVRERWSMKPIANATLGIRSFSGSCGTDFCAGGSLYALTVSNSDGTFKMPLPKGYKGTVECYMPDSVKSRYPYLGIAFASAEQPSLEVNPEPFSQLKLAVHIRNNRYGKIDIYPSRLTSLDWDQGSTLKGTNVDTTFIFRCFAETRFNYSYQLTNLNHDSLAFNVFNVPLGRIRDTFYHVVEIDVSKLRLFKPGG